MAGEPAAEGLQRRPYRLRLETVREEGDQGCEAHARWHPFATRITGEHGLGATRACAVVVGKDPRDQGPLRRGRRIPTDQLGHQARLDRLQSHGPRLAHRLRARAARRQHGGQGRQRLPAEECSHSADAPIVRRKLHQTQQPIVVGLRGLRRDGRGAHSGPAGAPESPPVTGARSQRHGRPAAVDVPQDLGASWAPRRCRESAAPRRRRT